MKLFDRLSGLCASIATGGGMSGALIALLALLVLSPSAWAQSCDCDVSDSREQSADALLVLDADEKQDAESTHLLFGVPNGPSGATNETVFHNRHYIINYDADLLVPTWVAYRLRKSDVNVPRERTECFRRDPRLAAGTGALCSDYEEPVFDRGHMVPNADMTRSLNAMLNTYMFTNMAPQHDKFNRVIWARLEGYVRDWARQKGEIFVITGAVFDHDDDSDRDADSDAETMEGTDQGTDRVAIPSHFYKIILHEKPNSFIEVMAFLLPHEDKSIKGKKNAEKFLLDNSESISVIEEMTGVSFLPDLVADNASKATAVKGFKALTLWPRN